MIREVSVQNAFGETLTIKLKPNDLPGYTLISVTGLGSPKMLVNTTGGPDFDGERVNSSKADKRTCVLNMTINGTGTTEEERRKNVYRMFPVHQQLKFGIKTDTLEVFGECFVESIEMNSFATIQNVSITLMFPYPYFKDVNTSEEYLLGIEPYFTFPFSNESLDFPLLVMGEILSVIENEILYMGTQKTGVMISIKALGPYTNVTIYNTTHNESIEIDTSIVEEVLGSPIELGDTILINTKVGEKSIQVQRLGLTYDIMNSISIFTEWIYLHPGLNNIQVATDAETDNLEVVIQYNQLYEGI